jgi:hypothetical protein
MSGFGHNVMYAKQTEQTEWKSDWRLEFERRSAEDAARPQRKRKRPAVAAKPTRVRRVREQAGAQTVAERRERAMSARRAWRAKRIAEGLCLDCPEAAAPGHTMCGECLEHRRSYANTRNARLLAEVQR